MKAFVLQSETIAAALVILLLALLPLVLDPFRLSLASK